MARVDRSPPTSPLVKLNQVDMACDEFERRLRSGEPVTAAQFLQEHDLECTSSLLRELLLVEFDYRRRRGDSFSAEDYANDFADHRDTINEVMRMSTLDGRPGSGLQQETRVLAMPDLTDRYHLEREVGHGSFGRVFRARDNLLDRVVAIKVLHPWLVASDGATQRFMREARNVAQLHHAGIVPVFEIEQHASGPFIVAEFADGPTLAQELKRRRFAFREAASLMAEISRALQYAHTRGVVHRDLKPSNIILQRADSHPDAEQPSGPLGAYRPRLLDFGLARRGDSEATLTLSGEVVGTPAYMSPEQAQGKGHTVDGSSDIFSLGAILYHLLTGKPTFRGEVHDVIRRVATEEVPPVRRANPHVPADLAAICEKCLERNPHGRYASAEELADDLQRWLNGQPVRARAVSAGKRLWRRCRRQPAGLAVAAALLMLVTAAAAMFHQPSTPPGVLRPERAHQRVERMFSVPAGELRAALRSVHEMPECVPVLQHARRDDSLSERDRRRIRLALLAHDPAFATHVFDDLLAADVREFLIICEQLRPHASDYVDELHRIVKSPNAATRPGLWLRAVCALAQFQPDADIFREIAPQLAEQLASQPSEQAAAWARAAAPVRDVLHAPLSALMHGEDPSDARRLLACELLASFLSDQPEELASLLLQTDPPQHAVVMQALLPHKAPAAEHLAEHAARLDRTIATGGQDEQTARTRATAAIGLLTLGREDAAWARLRDDPDPRIRSYFIHTAAPRGLPPHVLLERLPAETDPGAQYAIMLALATYPSGDLSPTQKQSLVDVLHDRYREHPDSGVHAAAGWLLRQWGEADLVAACDKQLIKEGIVEGRNWYVNTLGQTMIILNLADTSSIGDGQLPRTRRVAVAATETTYAHMRRFRKDFTLDPATCPDDACPAVDVSFHDAAAFCRWLSEEELPGTDRLAVVQSVAQESDPDAITTRIDPAAPGYRPPLGEEWGLACGAGSRLERFFGSKVTPFLAAYCNDQSELSAAGAHMPNRLGFFDVYGNAHEWTASLMRGPETSNSNAEIDVGRKTIVVHRGGAHNSPTQYIDTSIESPNSASRSRHNLGFRIARTLPGANR